MSTDNKHFEYGVRQDVDTFLQRFSTAGDLPQANLLANAITYLCLLATDGNDKRIRELKPTPSDETIAEYRKNAHYLNLISETGNMAPDIRGVLRAFLEENPFLKVELDSVQNLISASSAQHGQEADRSR